MQVSIIGSCVTRDALEVVAGLKIGPYIGRASLASIASRPSRRMRTLRLEFTDQAHPWHRRVAAADLEKTHEELIHAMVGGYVVIDLIEERVDLVRVGRNKYVTRSQIMSAMSNFDQHAGPPIRIFSSDGLRIWRRGLPRFCRVLLRHLPANRIIIHRALYADGDRPIGDENAYLTEMYSDLQSALPDAWVVSPSPDVFVASPDHRWGPAPFHYVDAYYREIAAKILAVCGLELPFKDAFSFQRAPMG